jgi:hypothetical protein
MSAAMAAPAINAAIATPPTNSLFMITPERQRTTFSEIITSALAVCCRRTATPRIGIQRLILN